MYIEPTAYMDLLNQLDSLKIQNQALAAENSILAQHLFHSKQDILFLTLNHQELEKLQTKRHQELLSHQKDHSKNLQNTIIDASKSSRQFLEGKFNMLETSSFRKLKELQVKNTLNRIENHQLLDIFQKIKKIYSRNGGEQNQPCAKEVLKWIKLLAMKESGKCKEKSEKTKVSQDGNWRGSGQCQKRK